MSPATGVLPAGGVTVALSPVPEVFFATVPTPRKCIAFVNDSAFTETVVTEPPDVVTPTVIPVAVLVTVLDEIAAILELAICSTVLPLTVRDVAETVVAEKVAVLETVRFVKFPVVAVTVLFSASTMSSMSETLLSKSSTEPVSVVHPLTEAFVLPSFT